MLAAPAVRQGSRIVERAAPTEARNVVPCLSQVAGLVLLASITLAPGSASAVEPERPGQESFLSRAVFADGRLWILSDAGVLSSISEHQDALIAERLPEPAFDLCVQDGHLLVVTGNREGGGEWTLRHRIASTWTIGAKVPTEGDSLISLECAKNRTTLLTTRRLIDIADGTQRTVALSEKVGVGLTSSVYGTSDHLYVGINVGEWGGGLRRIDRSTGTVTTIERNATGDLCGGPLNTSCYPVTGLAGLPWKGGCVAAAVGLVHMRPHGRLVEVCGDNVERLYYKPFGNESASNDNENGEPFSTVAFFGVTRVDETLWAVGIDGIYSIGRDGVAQIIPLPTFEDVGGIKVSFALPHLVLVLTDINQRRSVGGSVPILVPR